MLDPNNLEAAQQLANLALAELSLLDFSSSTSPPRAYLLGLLGCLLSTLPPLDDGDPSLAHECRRHLLASLGRLLSRNPSPSLLPALEAFTEIFCSSDFNRLTLADCAASDASRVFKVAPPCHGDINTLLELVSCHFISSLQDLGGFELFWSALSWSWKASQGIPSIDFCGSLYLVCKTSLFSLPAVVKAHVLLLASRCITCRNLNSHFLSFELAMDLYVRYLPALGAFNRTGDVKSLCCCFTKEKTFSCSSNDATDPKLRCHINRLLLFCQSHSGDDMSINEGDLFSSSVRFIEENKHVLHEKFRLEATMVVKSLVSSILNSEKQRKMHKFDAEVSEDIICLAAALRLMAHSLLQILHHFNHMRTTDDMGNKNSVTLHQISEIICLLGQFEADKTHRFDLFGIFRESVYRERASMLLLAHFASLSICCIRMRLGFLWKGCIIMMMAGMNLVIAQEKSLSIFQFLIAAVGTNMDVVNLKRRRSSTAVALRYKQLHKAHSPIEDGCFISDGSSLGTPQNSDSRIGKVGGRAFFMCHPEYEPNSLDWNDIEDFVECEKGMDYSYFLERPKVFQRYEHLKWHQRRRSTVKSFILGL
ncbi:hypothetical protein ACP4OV_005748 [Aristida adscensionis]